MNYSARIISHKQCRRFLPALLLFIVLMPYAAPVEAGESPVPQALGPMKLERLQSGEEARKAIGKLHGKPLKFHEGYIASYKDGGKTATIWISVYDSENAAKKELARMADGIKMGNGEVFRHFKELSIKGVAVYFVTGMGRAHYFFKIGTRMFWLAVEPSEARQAIRDLLEKIS